MSTITGFGSVPFSYRPTPQASDAGQSTAHSPDASNTASTGGGADTAQSSEAAAPAGFTAVPRLSADLIGALIRSQSEQPNGGTSAVPTSAQATTSAGAPAGDNQPATPPDTTSSDPSSTSPTLQEIAAQFDLHHLTHRQEQELRKELVLSGALSQKGGVGLFAKAVLSDGQHYRTINSQPAATTPSPPGTSSGNHASGGPQFDLVQRFQQAAAADQASGDTQAAASDQKILDLLNQLDSIRNGSTA